MSRLPDIIFSSENEMVSVKRKKTAWLHYNNAPKILILNVNA